MGSLVSLLPIVQPLVIGKGAALTSATVVMLAAPEPAHAESAAFYYNRGIDKYDNGDYYGAISDYNKAIEINPRYAKAYVNRGIAKRKSGDNYGAISDYNKAIEINPSDADSYFNLGTIKAIELKDYYGSISDFNKAIEINSTDKSAWKNRGSAKKAIGDMKGACADWRKAVSLGHDNADELVRDYC